MKEQDGQQGVEEPLVEGEAFLHYFEGSARPLIRAVFRMAAEQYPEDAHYVLGAVERIIENRLADYDRPLGVEDAEIFEQTLAWLDQDPESGYLLADLYRKQVYHRKYGATPEEWTSQLTSTVRQDAILRDLGYSGPPLNRWDAMKEIDELKLAKHGMVADKHGR
jgi:hypothetical protein